MYILWRLWGKIHFSIEHFVFIVLALQDDNSSFHCSPLFLLASPNSLPSALFVLISCQILSYDYSLLPWSPTICTPSQLFLIILPCCYDRPLPSPTNCTPFICLCGPCHCQSWLFSNHPSSFISTDTCTRNHAFLAVCFGFAKIQAITQIDCYHSWLSAGQSTIILIMVNRCNFIKPHWQVHLCII